MDCRNFAVFPRVPAQQDIADVEDDESLMEPGPFDPDILIQVRDVLWVVCLIISAYVVLHPYGTSGSRATRQRESPPVTKRVKCSRGGP